MKRKNIYTSDADVAFGHNHGDSTRKRNDTITSHSDDGSGDHRISKKSRKTSNFSEGQKLVSSSPPIPQEKPEDIAAGSSPIIITPPLKPPHPPSSSSSPASVLFVQNSASSSASETILQLSVGESAPLFRSQTANQTSRFHISIPAATCFTLTINPSSNNENSNGRKEDERLDLNAARRLIFDSTTSGVVIDGHKSDHQSMPLNRLKELPEEEPTYEIVGKKAAKGAML